MDAILAQTKEELKRFSAKKNSIKSLFIGGGTPSSIPHELYKPFFDLVHDYLMESCEITTEANPNSANLTWLEGMKKLGVSRVSFGVQSFDEEKLKFLGRNHNKTQAIQAIQNAKKAGFENISLDLIYATKLDTQELLEEDIKTAMSLGINHLSSYALTIEENTKFQDKHEYTNNTTELATFFIEKVKELGFEQYEISNFGQYQSIHNLGYWRGEDYIGVGSGAVGFLKNKRFYPPNEIEKYIENPLHVEIESLSEKDLHVEKIFLALRSKIGFEKSILSEREQGKVTLLEEEKKLFFKEGRYYNQDYLLADEIALFILD